VIVLRSRSLLGGWQEGRLQSGRLAGLGSRRLLGVGDECGDDSRGAAGDGGPDGDLLLVGAVGAVDLERGEQGLADVVRGLGEQPGGVGKHVDEVCVANRGGLGAEFGELSLEGRGAG
jgi:hypothetical protein